MYRRCWKQQEKILKKKERVNFQLTVLWSLYQLIPIFQKHFFHSLMPFVLCFLLFIISCSFEMWEFLLDGFHNWMVCPQKLYPHPKSQSILNKSQLVETDSLPSIFISVALFAAVQRPGRTFHPFPASPIPYFVKLLRSCTRMHKNFLHRHPVST